MAELPDGLKADLENRRNRDVTQQDVAEILLKGNRPYYSVGQIKARLPQDIKSDPPIRARLGELVDAEHVREEQVGRMQLYWWNYPETDWPKPPDVEVSPVPDEMTVSEFFDLSAVKKGARSVGVILVSTFLIITGTLIHVGFVTGDGILYQAIVWVVGISFLFAIGGFLYLFWGVYKFLSSEQVTFS